MHSKTTFIAPFNSSALLLTAITLGFGFAKKLKYVLINVMTARHYSLLPRFLGHHRQLDKRSVATVLSLQQYNFTVNCRLLFKFMFCGTHFIFYGVLHQYYQLM